jgi:predicted nucleic acid-binding protein
MIFVDTNIFVYARDSGPAAKQLIAADWLSRLWQQRTGRTGIQVLNEYYVTVTRKLKPGIEPDDAWDDIQALMLWNPQPVDRDVLNSARDIERRYRIGWWDAMIVAAALTQHCQILLSEDLQHGMRFGELRVQDPFRSTVEESSAEQPPALKSRPRHRPRGRPSTAS